MGYAGCSRRGGQALTEEVTRPPPSPLPILRSSVNTGLIVWGGVKGTAGEKLGCYAVSIGGSSHSRPFHSRSHQPSDWESALQQLHHDPITRSRSLSLRLSPSLCLSLSVSVSRPHTQVHKHIHECIGTYAHSRSVTSTWSTGNKTESRVSVELPHINFSRSISRKGPCVGEQVL